MLHHILFKRRALEEIVGADIDVFLGAAWARLCCRRETT